MAAASLTFNQLLLHLSRTAKNKIIMRNFEHTIKSRLYSILFIFLWWLHLDKKKKMKRTQLFIIMTFFWQIDKEPINNTTNSVQK